MRDKKSKILISTQILKVRRTMKEIKINKHTLLINLLDHFCAGRENQTHCVALLIQSIEINDTTSFTVSVCV